GEILLRLQDAGADGTFGTEDDAIREQFVHVTLNTPPTLDVISDRRILPASGEQSILISGITSGDDDRKSLRVTATSSNTTVVADPTSIYNERTLPTTGELRLTPLAVGTSDITVTVQDAGWDNQFGTDDDRSFARTFTVYVSAANAAPTAITLDNDSLAENLSGAIVGELTVADADSGDTHTFSVSDNRFEIVNGSLKLKDDVNLDYEEDSIVFVDVTATDSGSPGLAVTESFVLNVADINEPITGISLSNDRVNENEFGAALGALTVNDPDLGDQHAFTVSDPRFEIVGGNLKLKAGVGLNFEAASEVAVNVTATDSGTPPTTFTQSFTVRVNDVNEPPLTIVFVNENSSGEVLAQLLADDPDANSVTTFSVSDDRFEVANNRLKLKDGMSLDFESEASITLTLTAFDASAPTHTLSQLVSVNVNDINDAPTNVVLSAATLREHQAGVAVGTVMVNDPDASDSHVTTVSDPRFEIVGGTLRLKAGQAVDHGTEPTITLNLTATDNGSPQRSLTKSVTLTVLEELVTNAAPTGIQLSNANIAENVSGASIGSVTVTDPDAGDVHAISVSDNRFEIVNGLLKLKAGQSLNFESTPTISLMITATDSGTPALSVTKPFTITVANVNETPTSLTLSKSSLEENVAGGLVGSLLVVDPDVGDSHSFVVSDSRFEVKDGQLKLKAGVVLDHEAAETISLSVTATDSGSPALSRTQSFVVTVLDVNEAPTSVIVTTEPIAENELGAVIGDVAVVDPDVNDTHTIVVSDPRFEVVGGRLKLKSGQSLNFEAGATLLLDITATDSGTPGLSVSKAVTVSVNDVNEFDPVIQAASFSIDENSSSGSVVGSVAVSDQDTSQSHSFAITSGNAGNAFAIDKEGRITVASNATLNFEQIASYTLTVAATDSGTPARSSSKSFEVKVNDVNDAPSQITIDTVEVSEKLAGAVVGTITVIDEDASDTHQLSIGDDRFEIVGTTVKLKDGVFLSYASETTISIEVTAVDSGDPAGSLVTSIPLSILENEFPWHNAANPVDTTRDGKVTPLDALVGINLLNEIGNPLLIGGRKLPTSRPASSALAYYDVNGDGALSPLDVLIVINYLNSQFGSEGESPTKLPLGAVHSLEPTNEIPGERRVIETSLGESTAPCTNDDYFRIVGEREQMVRSRIRGSSAEEVNLSDVLDTLARDLALRWWSDS
ncbi:MAG TPA: cadherin domain-containing protein, partial [Pirellulaceae bacterium]|nr:cadherin domain-containing protein [Pirellulaceae bacterium]